jgi:hypothetical protein
VCETGGKNDEVNQAELKSAIPMKLEQRQVIKFLHLKGLKLDDIVTKLSNMYGQDVYAKSSIKQWLHQLRLGRKDLTHNIWAGQPPSTIPMLKFYRFFGDLLFPQCKQLTTTWTFHCLRHISTWPKRLGSKTP